MQKSEKFFFPLFITLDVFQMKSLYDFCAPSLTSFAHFTQNHLILLVFKWDFFTHSLLPILHYYVIVHTHKQFKLSRRRSIGFPSHLIWDFFLLRLEITRKNFPLSRIAVDVICVLPLCLLFRIHDKMSHCEISVKFKLLRKLYRYIEI
jgi:hypothetical protein